MLQVRGKTAQDLRMSVVAEMRSNWPRYAPFIEDRLHANYLANMALPTTYAGHPELVALSAVFRVTISVWGADETTDISSSADPDLPILHLAHRNAGNYLDHYWAADFP